MIYYSIIQIVLIILIGILAISAKQAAIKRWVLTLLATITITVTGYFYLELLSLPKQYYFEWRVGKAEILAYHWEESRAIYLWVKFPEEAFPRNYTMPWSEETAEMLNSAADGKEDGDILMAEFGEMLEGTTEHSIESNKIEDNNLWMPSLERRAVPKIYLLPPAASPPKTDVEERAVPMFDFESDR
tara:strand:- start:462 stop:1022 length:561 start_codon:yes stop_codon:yes gene_type:complete